jgi:hypothetical protein
MTLYHSENSVEKGRVQNRQNRQNGNHGRERKEKDMKGKD